LDTVVDTIPSPLEIPIQPTPVQDILPDITLAALTSAVLPPVNVDTVIKRPPLPKIPAHRINIPAFDPLGILGPRTLLEDKGYSDARALEDRYASPLQIPIDGAGAISPDPSPGILNDPEAAVPSLPRHFVFVSTPPSDMPEEPGPIDRDESIRTVLEVGETGVDAGGTGRLSSETSTIQLPVHQDWLDELASVISRSTTFSEILLTNNQYPLAIPHLV
jgi:hypothetical protein